MSKQDEIFVSGFFESIDLIVEKIDSTRSKQKSPDFRVDTKEGFSFYCEVKSLQYDDGETEMLHNTLYNTIERKIKQASEQFESINKHKFAANVLIIVSHNYRINWNSLKSFLQGYVSVSVSNKKVRNILYDARKQRDGKNFYSVRNIDLFIWFNNSDPNYFFNSSNEMFLKRLQKIFNVNNFEYLEILK